MPAMRKPTRRRAAKPRVRRTAEDARSAILDATERRLVERGPSGIRLQDVAADVGVSHPTILHHFGSREQLVEAVIQRRARAMNQEVILALISVREANREPAAIALFERLYEAFGPRGHGRVMAYRALEGRAATLNSESLRPLAEATHAARVARRPPEQPAPAFEDTEHIVHLAALALFAESIVGGLLRGDPEGHPDEAASKRFRDWLAKHMIATLER